MQSASPERLGEGGAFGEREVGRMFSALSRAYDGFNYWSSLGMVRWWRERLIRALGPSVRRVLDVGAGTGGLSRRALKRLGPSAMVVGLDLSAEMLALARRAGGDYVQGSAARLPFKDGAFGAVVSAYVLRNLREGGVLAAALGESHRVLSTGGRLIFLDLTRPRARLVRWGHALYTRTVMPLVGHVAFGGKWPGAYLRRSIENLAAADDLPALFAAAGFKNYRVRSFAGGLVGLFEAEK